MNTKLLETIYDDMRVSINYDNGKELRFFYSKKEFVSLSVDECLTDSAIIGKAGQYKKIITCIAKLVLWIKGDKYLGKKLNKCLEDYFKCDIGYDMYLLNNGIAVECMGEKFFINTKRVDATFTDCPIVKALLKAAAFTKKNKIRFASAILPEEILKQFNTQLKQIYIQTLKNSTVWMEYESYIKDLYVMYEEFKENMEKYGFYYQNECMELAEAEDIINSLDCDTYEITIEDCEIKFYKNLTEKFCISKNGMKGLYNIENFKNIKNSLSLIWKVQHDIHILFDGLKKDNLFFRFNTEGKLWIHSYAGCKRPSTPHDIYMFAADTARNIHKVKDGKVEDLKLLDYITGGNIGCLRQCMEVFGKISYEKYYAICSYRFENKLEIRKIYDNIPNLLNTLQKKGIVESWHINGDGTYSAEFLNNELLKYECSEVNDDIYRYGRYTFTEMIEKLPPKYVKDFFGNKDAVFSNTKEILAALNQKEFCDEYKTFIVKILPYLNEKYMPMLDLQVRQSSSVYIMGEILVREIKEFLERRKHDEKQ